MNADHIAGMLIGMLIGIWLVLFGIGIWTHFQGEYITLVPVIIVLGVWGVIFFIYEK